MGTHLTFAHNIIFLDFETYYDTEYSLSRLTPPEYILDPKYETICCAIKEGNGTPYLVDGPNFAQWASGVEWEHTTTVTFNALFDNCILAWRYGIKPQVMLCAMRMAVALRGHELRSASLSSVSKLLGVGIKGTEIENARGKRRAQIISSGGWPRYTQYALNDVELCAQIFFKLAPEFPEAEMRVMDHVLRCAMEPRFDVDTSMLAAHLKDLENEKQQLLNDAGVNDPGELQSAARFRELLEAQGVDIVTKPSPRNPANEVPAFAKTDQFMVDLQEDENPIVRALTCARLGIKSNIEQNRGTRMLAIASLPWPKNYCDGNLPVPLRYSGAHTHRLSGDWKYNMQNLPSGRGGVVTKLRTSLRAPTGHKVIAADLAQIECRINAWFCGQDDLLGEFASGGDPYCSIASRTFGFPVNKADHPLHRFIGKGEQLGLGFGCGKDKFYNMVIRDARKFGMDMDALMQIWNRSICATAVNAYRYKYTKIKIMWGTLDTIISTAWMGKTGPIKVGPGGCVEIGHGYVLLPNGMNMRYDPFYDSSTDTYYYRYGKSVHKMYGCKMLENIVQALARIVLFNASLRLWDQGLRFCMTTHDELVYIEPEDNVTAAKQLIESQITRRPSWGKDIPLGVEIGVGDNYGECK